MKTLTSNDKNYLYELLADLQKLLFDKQLKENAYQKIIQKTCFLEDFVTSKKINTFKKGRVLFIQC